MSAEGQAAHEQAPPIEADEPVATLTFRGSVSSSERRRLELALQGEADGATYDLDLEHAGEGFVSYLVTPDDQPIGGVAEDG